MIRVILFDIDGTLIRTGGAGIRAFARAFASEFGITNSTDNLSFAGRTDPSLVREVFRRARLDGSPRHFAQFFTAYLGELKRLLAETAGAPCPGARELLENFRALPRAPLVGLLTGNIRRGAELKLRHYGLSEYFEFGAFGDDAECRNELAGIARQRASDLLGGAVAGKEILVIGDTPLDVACANAIQAQVLAVATGSHPLEQLKACQPTWAFETLLETTAAFLCGASPNAGL